MFAYAMAPKETRILFLQMTTIGQQHTTESLRCRMAIHRPAVTIAIENGQIAGMIKVRMGQHHRTEAITIQRQALPVALAQPLVALKEPAIHQHLGITTTDQKFRASDGFGTAKKGYFHCLPPTVYSQNRHR